MMIRSYKKKAALIERRFFICSNFDYSTVTDLARLRG
jgi:hypothetical protein